MERPTTHGLRDYLSILRRRKWIFVFEVVAVPAAAVVFSMRQQNVYQASAQVLLNRQNLPQAIAGIGPDPTLYQQPQRITATQADLAKTPEVAASVLAALKLPRQLESHVRGAMRVGAARREVAAMLRISGYRARASLRD